MSAVFAPYGFMPVHPWGGGTAGRSTRCIKGGIASAYATDIARFDPIKLLTDGTFARAAAGDTDIAGIFAGVDYTPTGAGAARTTRPNWTASTAATDIDVYFWPDVDEMVLACQANASLAKTAIGDCADLVAGTTNPSSGWSRSYLAALVGAGNSAQFKIVGLREIAGNAWGDTYTQVLVKVNEAGLGFLRGNAV